MERVKANQDIRQAITAAGLFQYQVAAAMHMPEYSFVRLLRVELDQERKRAVFAAIEELRKEAMQE